MPGPFSTVLFDLDDTLLDSFEARLITLEAVFSFAGIYYPDAEQFLYDLQGSSFIDAVARLEKEQNIDIDLYSNYRSRYWTKKPGTLRLYPGIREILEQFHSQGTKLGIVTQKYRSIEVEGYPAGAIQELKELEITELFSVIVGFEDVTEHKPHPAAINLAINSLGSKPEETVMVGDSAADMEAARAAGCFSCYAIWGLPASEHKTDIIRADKVAAMPDALLGLEYL
jgi:pyrophosphatase PpaX